MSNQNTDPIKDPIVNPIKSPLKSPIKSPIKSRVIRVDKESCVTFMEEANQMIVLKTDAVRWKGGAIAVGDFVEMEISSDANEYGYVLTKLLPRKTALSRKDPSGHNKPQIIASNMDLVALIHGLDQKINISRIERALVLIAESGAAAQLILNKADLVEPDYTRECCKRLAELQLKKSILVTSAVTGEGISDLNSLLIGDKTIVFLGSSGVGKSSLINTLISKPSQKTAEVRKADAKGRHTTIARELITLPRGGYIIDTPGLRAMGLDEIDTGLEEVFSEIAELAKGCQFRDCAHINEPECSVKDAVKSGDLLAARLERYLYLKKEVREAEKEKREANEK